jgi:hypothetical protein
MSIGLTDSSYWKKIGEWLIGNRSHHLLIFYKLAEGDKIHPETKIANFNFIRDNYNYEEIIQQTILGKIDKTDAMRLLQFELDNYDKRGKYNGYTQTL